MSGRGLAVAAAAALAFTSAAPAAAQLTTEDRTITGDAGAAYSTLSFGPGWERVVRDELATPLPGRETTRDSLLYFAQFSDFQLADEESPARVETLDIDGTPFISAWRPQEALEPFVVDQAVRGVNEFDASPVPQGDGSAAPLALSITTGDSADSNQRNEVEWVVGLLEGGTINPNSGTEGGCPGVPAGEAARYTGVQDYDDYLESNYFYDPDQPAGRHAAWPRYPGLMDRAQLPFDAAGLERPSYVALGNHDGLVQGNVAANAAYELVATGCLKPFQGPLPLGELGPGFLETHPEQVVQVPKDERRAYVDKKQYRGLHATGAQADEHGFAFVDPAETAASAGAASYYTWTPAPGVRMISLDTVAEGGQVSDGGAGNIDDAQFRWLDRTLTAADQAGELVILFGHHPIRSLTVQFPDELALPCLLDDRHGHDLNPGCDRDLRNSQPVHRGADLQSQLLAHPHVIAYVAGHTHEHRITPFRRASGGGFWGIETSSETDWPIQSRLLDVMDNADGTLSIFGTLIDHAGPIATPPPGTPASSLTPVDLASLGREFSFNDPQVGSPGGEGQPADRNVELLVSDPRD